MERTKNMKYAQTAESNELYMFATNTAELWRSRIQPAIDNLIRKYARGVYDHDRAVDLFYYVMTDASKMYGKMYGYTFSVTDRFTASVDMEKYIFDDYISA